MDRRNFARIIFAPPRLLGRLWRGPSGWGEVLSIAWPLILSSGSWSVQHFVDRMFLNWYSPDAMAASMPAGMLQWTLTSFFLGTAAYVNTFVAQYHGARRPGRLVASVWQSIYFSLFASLLIVACIPLGMRLLAWADHGPDIVPMEQAYFRILCLGAFFAICSSALSGFFTGRGKTWPVMWVSILVTALNILFDYAWIFGNWGFPSGGIVGAAWATVCATAMGTATYAWLFFRPSIRRQFQTMAHWRFDRELFGRLMRFGAPSGLHFTLEAAAFTLFVLLVGRLGVVELGATNIAFNINTLAFMPMIGFAIATSTLVGQHLGKNQPQLGARATWSAFHMTTFYMTVIAILYVAWPQWFIGPFAARADSEAFAPVGEMAVLLLRFVALYSIFDTMNVVFAAALKGAGDTRFVMLLTVGLAWPVMVAPTWWISRIPGGSIYQTWIFLTAYVIILGFCFLGRFIRGKWRFMRVIEEAPEEGEHPIHALGQPPVSEPGPIV